MHTSLFMWQEAVNHPGCRLQSLLSPLLILTWMTNKNQRTVCAGKHNTHKKQDENLLLFWHRFPNPQISPALWMWWHKLFFGKVFKISMSENLVNCYPTQNGKKKNNNPTTNIKSYAPYYHTIVRYSGSTKNFSETSGKVVFFLKAFNDKHTTDVSWDQRLSWNSWACLCFVPLNFDVFLQNWFTA